ncbi:ABC transporter permease [Streptomyces sampsonii]|nr:ABC transporter permease [Streptomyces sampsonii]
MTALAEPRLAGTAAARGGPFTGTGVLLRFMLRRDRIRLPAWVLGLTLLMTYFATALDTLLKTEEDLAGFSQFAGSPAGAMFGGPGFGFDALTIERFLAGQYGLYIVTGAGLMALLTVVRHTRVEEQAGRTELVRANVLGRHVQLTAALALAGLMAALLSLLITGVMAGRGYDAAGSLTFGASVGACALAVAGITAVAVQVSEYSRGASGIAGAALGGAFVLRALGDMAHVQGSGPSWLSWLSPIGWSQQAAPYTHDRWWPLLLSVALAAVTAAVGFRLSARRDVGAGLAPPRPGPRRAARWLNSPLTLAFRLHRASVTGWSSAVLVGGVAYGSFTQALLDGFEDAPEDLVAVMGGSEDLLNGYLGLMGLMWAFITTAYAILAVQTLRSEESEGRTEPVLATAVSRPAWLGSHLVVIGVTAAWLLLLAGLGDGLGAAVSTGDASLFGDVLLGHVAHTPAVWLVLALAALLYGAVPRALLLVWVAVGYGAVVGFFGPVLGLPDAALSVSPFEHVGEYPAEDLGIAAITVLCGLAVAVGACAIAAYRRRDITTGA